MWEAALCQQLPARGSVPTLCQPCLDALQLLAGTVQQRRIAAVISAPGVLASALSGALVPPQHLLGSPLARCAAALNFVMLTVGFLLPTYTVARRDARQAAQPEPAAGEPPASSPSSGDSNGNGNGSGGDNGKESSPEGSMGAGPSRAGGARPVGHGPAGASISASHVGAHGSSPGSSPHGSHVSSPFPSHVTSPRISQASSQYASPGSNPYSSPASTHSAAEGSLARPAMLAAAEALVAAGSALLWAALSCTAAWVAAAALAIPICAEGRTSH